MARIRVRRMAMRGAHLPNLSSNRIGRKLHRIRWPRACRENHVKRRADISPISFRQGKSEIYSPEASPATNVLALIAESMARPGNIVADA